uniref:Uncharacterized protein n=1 Tax=Timema cristinae TaxID=61476 RepID=A0A7R9D5L9_TIMCR|nr:unnamed protein product [Timema cristinae]
MNLQYHNNGGGTPSRQSNSEKQRPTIAPPLSSLNDDRGVVSSNYVGKIFQAFNSHEFYKDITTLRELSESGSPIAVPHQTLIDSFSGVNESDPSILALSRKMYLSEEEFYGNDVTYNSGLIILDDKARLKHFKSFWADGKERLHIVEECLGTHFISYIVPKMSPYVDKFNLILDKLVETGHIDKWTEDSFRNIKTNTLWSDGHIRDEAPIIVCLMVTTTLDLQQCGLSCDLKEQG